MNKEESVKKLYWLIFLVNLFTFDIWSIESIHLIGKRKHISEKNHELEICLTYEVVRIIKGEHDSKEIEVYVEEKNIERLKRYYMQAAPQLLRLVKNEGKIYFDILNRGLNLDQKRGNLDRIRERSRSRRVNTLGRQETDIQKKNLKVYSINEYDKESVPLVIMGYIKETYRKSSMNFKEVKIVYSVKHVLHGEYEKDDIVVHFMDEEVDKFEAYYQSGVSLVLYLEKKSDVYRFKEPSKKEKLIVKKKVANQEAVVKSIDSSYIEEVWHKATVLHSKYDWKKIGEYQSFRINQFNVENEDKYYSGFKILVPQEVDKDLLLSFYRTTKPFKYNFIYKVYSEDSVEIDLKRKVVSRISLEKKEFYPGLNKMSFCRVDKNSLEPGKEYLFCFELSNELVKEIDVAYTFIESDEKDLTKYHGIRSSENQFDPQKVYRKLPYATISLKDKQKVDQRNDFLKKIAHKFPKLKLKVDSSGLAVFQKIVLNENPISHRGLNYSGFRFDVPRNKHNHFHWSYFCEEPKGYADSQGWFIVGTTGKIFQGFTDYDIKEVPSDLKMKFPESKLMVVQKVNNPLSAGKEYFIWFSKDSLFPQQHQIAFNFNDKWGDDFERLLPIENMKSVEEIELEKKALADWDRDRKSVLDIYPDVIEWVREPSGRLTITQVGSEKTNIEYRKPFMIEKLPTEDTKVVFSNRMALVEYINKIINSSSKSSTEELKIYFDGKLYERVEDIKDVKSGLHVLTILSKVDGKFKSESKTMMYDIKAPNIKISVPIHNEVSKHRDPVIRGYYSDDVSGVDIESFRIYLNGKLLNEGTIHLSHGWNSLISEDLDVGKYTVCVVLKDKIGFEKNFLSVFYVE